ncbi:putative protein tag-76 [Trichinella spiralis]|uniref:Protein argonaute-3 n=1 Tax=Trichinella spiralis TaxID=6334 RepID=A0A0V1BMR4_TRISP|nr:putative protein tag-76 [Trichinella spiralis]
MFGKVHEPHLISATVEQFLITELLLGQDTNVAADEVLQLRLKELVKRPGYGTVGKPIKLACNYFPLIKLQKGDIMVNRYHIDIQHPHIFGDPFKLAYDGMNTLFTVDKLHLKQVSEKADTEKFSFKTARENKPSELSILIKFTGLVHLDFRNAEAGSLDERKKGPIQFLDILFAQGRSSPIFELSKSFKAVRNSFYCIPQGAGADMKYGIELWRGLFISARVIDGFRPAINIDGVMEIGIEMPDSPKFYEQARKNDTVEMVFKRIADKCDRDGIKCDLVFVALFSSEQYAQVKSCGDITFGLVTQCVLPKTISDVAIKKSYSTMLNIAMKINMKIGGINTKLLEDEILDNYLYKNNALVIGVDVVHPSAVETHLPSIASVVGNVDTKVTKFHASVKLQPAKQELITGFIEQFSERLLEYLDVNGTAPKNIIVYRDGVSEGQFMQVLEEELSALRRACKSVATNYRPLITFIVVQKRHHARFFCCDEAAARGRGKNIPAGTVIDRVVTSPDEHDFFLCSHHGIQGTSRPTRYHVLFDESNMDANAMQSITYYLCHLYGRCARSVSIPAPKGDIMVNRYHIDIQHPRLKLNCDDNRDIFWAYAVKRSDIFGDPFKLAYDGKCTLFTVDKLHLKQVSEKADTEKFSFKTARENKPSELSILIKFTGLVHLDFRNAEAGSLDERKKGPIQFLDILFAQGRSSPIFELSKSFKAVRNSFYCIPQGAGADMKYGIELWRGLFISARVIDGFRPAINIDVSHSCFYKRQSLINLICDILNGDEREVKFHPNQLRLDTRLQPEQLSLLIPELKGVSIHTTHRNQDRIYRIKDILSTAVSMKFKRDGKEVSVAEYFRDVYGPLKYPNLPLVQVGSKTKAIYFPVELCQVANCQRYNKKLKACQTTSIIRFASTDAPTRNLKCIDMVKKSNFNSDPFLKSFGVQIKAEPMIVDGRVLPPPRLEYGKGNGGRQIILTPKDGAWNSNEFKFFESAYCESFGFVSFLPPHKASMLQEFCLQIVRTCRSTGIEMPDSPKFYEQARKNDTVEMVFKRIADKCDRDGIKCDLVFVALFSSEQYAQVKSCGDITFGLVTQCVLPKTISDVAIKKSYSTMENMGQYLR